MTTGVWAVTLHTDSKYSENIFTAVFADSDTAETAIAHGKIGMETGVATGFHVSWTTPGYGEVIRDANDSVCGSISFLPILTTPIDLV